MVNLNLDGPKKGKDRDFWDQYSEEISDFEEESEEDLNDGDWEEFEE